MLPRRPSLECHIGNRSEYPDKKHKKDGAIVSAESHRTLQNFSQGERKGKKNTLLLLTPASHFGLQRF